MIVDLVLAWGALLVGFVAGWIVRWRLAATPQTWTVVCGRCSSIREPGPRRQLSVEVWDSYGMMYKQWYVGEGEQLGTRPVGSWLLDAIAAEVRRINAYTAKPALTVVKFPKEAPF